MALFTRSHSVSGIELIPLPELDPASADVLGERILAAVAGIEADTALPAPVLEARDVLLQQHRALRSALGSGGGTESELEAFHTGLRAYLQRVIKAAESPELMDMADVLLAPLGAPGTEQY